MQVFVTGATGYIGLNVSIAFRRVGYRVFGLTRNEMNIPALERNEIIPVVGNLQEPDRFRNVVGKCEVIVHAATDYQVDAGNVDRNAVQFLLEEARRSTQPKKLIYTSSVWVFGNWKDQPLTENSPYSPPRVISWLPEIEQMVLLATDTKGLVIRPGVVYGKMGGLTGMWFRGASNGGVAQIVGDGQNHWAMVHVDDLAHGYLLAAQSDVGNESFNLVDPTRSTVVEMVSAAAKASGNIRQLEFIPSDKAIVEQGEFASALALDQVVDARKAHQLFGWQPQHKGFVTEIETYFRAWRASRKDKKENQK